MYGSLAWSEISILSFLDPGENLNVETTTILMAAAALQVLQSVFAPIYRLSSILRPSLLAGGLDILEISYQGTQLFLASNRPFKYFRSVYADTR